MLYNNILVIVDLKDDNRDLLNHALYLCREAQAKLYVAHVGGKVIELYSSLVIDRLEHTQVPLVGEGVTLLKECLSDCNHHATQDIELLEMAGNFDSQMQATLYKKHIDLIICRQQHEHLTRSVMAISRAANNQNVDVMLVSLSDESNQ
ncbi:hypothetical protein IBZ15_15945 [Serratia marcescens]|uniref:hypothetical protein n=1 Tax=Serratia marcescens TaxID=615 RepID=UPI001A2A239E|nr:hypothetical protein [Serratia marcescens]HAT5018251.1 hypothetical protein [Serratia marcescens]